MAVYVDKALIPFGGMRMSHMVADTREELLAMATAINLKHKHLQNAGEPNEHFDVCMSYRTRAIELGAIPIDSRGLVKIIRAKRRALEQEAEFARALEQTTPIEWPAEFDDLPPGMTDLMVPPETLDTYLGANPPPDGDTPLPEPDPDFGAEPLKVGAIVTAKDTPKRKPRTKK